MIKKSILQTLKKNHTVFSPIHSEIWKFDGRWITAKSHKGGNNFLILSNGLFFYEFAMEMSDLNIYLHKLYKFNNQ